jgi:hypothetical protein
MTKLRFVVAMIVAALAGAPSASAYPQKETDILSTVSFAVATAGQKNRKGAEAYCRKAKGEISSKKEEAYLFSHIERCFGAVAATLDDKTGACTHYKKALAIWEKTPPPNDHEQSVASRAQLSASMIRYQAENCAK